MAVGLRDNPVAKKKSADGKSPTKAVKIDRGLALKAESIARDKGMDMASYLSETLRSAIEKDWAKILRRIGDEE